MRLTLSFLLMAAMLVPGRLAAQQPAAAPAAQTPPPQPATPAGSVVPDIATSNFVDFGFRGTAYAEGSDEARYQRYRDLRNGFTVDAFRFAKTTDARWLVVTSDHVGYRDQRYTAAVNQFGRVKATFEWNQIPLFFSQDTLALHTTESPGVLRVADSIQSGIQGGTTTLPGVVNQAIPFEMRLKRSIADLRLTYTASPTIDVDFFLRSTSKTGSQPWAGGFGFSNAVELAVPVDTHHDGTGRVSRMGGHPGLGARRLRRLVLPQRRRHARVGQPASDYRLDIRAVSGPHAVVARQQPERHQRDGHLQPSRPQPRDRVCVYRQLVAECRGDPVHHQHSASDVRARPAHGRSRRPCHGDELQPHVEADGLAVVPGAVSLVRLRQPDADLRCDRYDLLRHVSVYVRSRRRQPLRAHAPDLRRGGLVDPAALHRSQGRIYGGGHRTDAAVRRFHDREQAEALGRSHRNELADAARGLRVRQARGLGLRRAGARRYRRAGVPAPVRHLRPDD